MSAEAAVFDYESVIEAAMVNAFTTGGFQASVYDQRSDPEFQRARARVELLFRLGGYEIPVRQLNDGTLRPQPFAPSCGSENNGPHSIA